MMMMGMSFFWIPVVFIAFIVVGIVGRYLSREHKQAGRQDYDRETPRRSPQRKLTEKQIFALAYKKGGTLTLSEIVLETGFSLKEAEEYMKKITDGVHITMEVTERGTLVYEFPELIERNF